MDYTPPPTPKAVLEFREKLSALLLNEQLHLFSCGEALDTRVSSDVGLRVFVEGESLPVSFPPESPDDIERLVNHCDVATFGRGEEELTDPTVRDAFKCVPPHFSFAPDPTELGILESVSRGLGLSARERVKTRLNQLNVYKKGGHFTSHADTPRAANMFGTLVVCLPSNFKGGDLRVSHKGMSQTFSWGPKASQGILQWAAFFSDCPHEVLPVEVGKRVTVTYDLLWETEEGSNSDEQLVRCDALECLLEEFLNSDEVCNWKGKIAFGLHHEYVFEKGFKGSYNWKLKGIDRQFDQTLRRLGFAPECQVAYGHRYLERAVDLPDSPDSDSSAEDPLNALEEYDSYCVYGGGTTDFQDDLPYQDDGSTFQDSIGASIMKAMWATVPFPGRGKKAPMFILGNEPCTDFCYRSAVLVIDCKVEKDSRVTKKRKSCKARRRRKSRTRVSVF